MTRITSNIHEDLGTLLIVSCSFLLTMRNVSDKSPREIQNTHFMFKNFFPKNCAIYEIMYKNMAELDRPQMTIQYGLSAWHAEQLRLQTHTQNM
jgi:hypothetical protein